MRTLAAFLLGLAVGVVLMTSRGRPPGFRRDLERALSHVKLIGAS